MTILRRISLARALLLASALAGASLAVAVAASGGEAAARAPSVRRCAPCDVPQDLVDTGLYADLEAHVIASDVLAYEPQYPLWTDGAAKRRWIHLPPGTSVDASDPDHLHFPAGTRLWKEFAFERRVETRYLALGDDGRWRYATYVWSEDERAATLAPERGVRAACQSAPGVPYDVPARADCRACHEAGPDRVLGFTALQLSSDRDPLAPHARTPEAGAVDLAELVRRGLVRGLPQALVDAPPRIEASSPRERAALGYLHANCGACHASDGELAGLGLDLAWSLADAASEPSAIATAADRASRFRAPGEPDALRIARGVPERSVLVRRMASRDPLSQMPPLGTHACDAEALDLVTAWIREDLAPRVAIPRPDSPRSTQGRP